MEYILHGTDIFDEKINELFKQELISDREKFIPGKAYKLTVTFNVDLLSDKRFDEFVLPVPSKANTGRKKDNIYEVLSHQLKKMQRVLEEFEIESHSSEIRGDELDDSQIIKVDVEEDISTPMFQGRGKNKIRMGTSVIMPSQPYIREIGSKFIAERLGEIYSKLMLTIKSKKWMSKILEIEETEDDRLLIDAFLQQYGELWTFNEEKRAELFDRLQERIMTVVKAENQNVGQEASESELQHDIQQLELF